MTALSADERQELAQSVRSACERLASEDRVRAVAYGEGDRGGADGHSGFDTALWDVLCNQVGVAAIALPEHLGGAGYGASALGVVAHELGRALAPVPFVSSTVLATGLLLDLTEHDPDADKRLTGLIEGRRTAAAALTGDGGLWRPSAVTLRAARTGDGWSIDGTVRHVLGGSAADDLVVVAIDEDGEPALFLLDPTVDGVVAEAERVLDGTRPMATITLSSAPALRLSGDGPLGDVVERNVDIALAVLSAEQVGACERVLEIATDYARTREQFGRRIGSFQAIKHKCADMLVDLEWARSASQAALEALDDSDAAAAGEADWRASMAKAVCSEALRNAAKANVQIHGGIGFTWEDSAHLYFRRARTDEVVFGTPGQHWDRLSALGPSTQVSASPDVPERPERLRRATRRDPLVPGQRTEAGRSTELRAHAHRGRRRTRPDLAPLPRRPRLRLPALAARIRRCRSDGGVPGRLRRGVRTRRRAPSAEHHRRRPGRSGADQVRQPRSRRTATWNRSDWATTSGVSSSPSPAPDQTSPACAPVPSAPRRVGASMARRCGVRRPPRPASGCCSPAPVRTSTVTCRCSLCRWTSRGSRCAR